LIVVKRSTAVSLSILFALFGLTLTITLLLKSPSAAFFRHAAFARNCG